MKGFGIALAAALLIVTLACDLGFAQATAQINGTVVDQSGAVLPGVEITATQTETGISRSTITNETGNYILPNLPIGPYRLEAALPGFRTFAQTGIVLQINSSPAIRIVLEVGQVAETVEVQANAAMVETRTSTVGEVIENARILELPLNGRDVRDLITLAGGAVETGSRGILGRWVSVNGGVGYGVEYTLDGANHLNFTSGTGMPMPFPDALQEFTVENSGVGAQRSNAASVGAVTKAGTNEYHGTLFEFVRNDLFNARNYFATKGSTLKRHQFGGTIGGPIVQNKLFFFGGYQGTTLRQDPSDIRQFVPTATMLAGDWTTFTSPACNNGRQRNLSAPFVGNRIDPALFSPAARNIAARLPKAQNECGEIIFGRRNTIDDMQIVARGDYQMTDSHSLFGRYYALGIDDTSAYKFTPDNILNAGVQGNDELAQSITIGSTYLLDPTTVHSFRLGYNRTAQLRVGNAYFSVCDMGVQTFCGYAPTWSYVTVSGGFQLRGTADPTLDVAEPNRYIVETYHLTDDLSLVRGDHQIAFGGNLMRGKSYSYSYFVAPGQWSFNGQQTGLGMADFMLGRAASLLQGAKGNHAATQWMTALYATDTWKAKPNFTLTYGLRWEPYLPQIIPTGVIYQFDMDRFIKGVYSSVYRNAPAGFYYPGDPGFPGLKGQTNQWLQFAPRLGLAWDPSGNGTTSLRASYSYGFNYVSLDFRRDQNGSSPFANRTALSTPNFDDPWRNVPGGAPFPVVLRPDSPFAPSGAFLTSRYDAKTPQTGSWNLSLQHQVGESWLLSSTYIGTQTSHLWVQRQLNPAIYMPGASCVINGVTHTPCSSLNNIDDRRLLTMLRPHDGESIGPIAEFSDGGTQSYNGLVLSVQRRGRGINVSGNYTWSHCIGDYADLHSMGPGAEETYVDPNNRAYDRGNCNGDRRNVFNLTSVAETPQFANPTMRAIGSGWRLSGIYRVSSGTPLHIVSGVDRQLTDIASQRPDQIAATVTGSSGPRDRYLILEAFAQPAIGTLGNLGRNAVRGPKTWAFDLALSRVFNLTERHRLEFRAEAYNVTNSFRPAAPNLQLNNANFGVILNSQDPRIMQFALKYVF
jgi:hypothetical protein